MNKGKKYQELDVDSVGNQEPLTHDQERQISEFIKKRKAKLSIKKKKKENAG